MGPDMGAEGKHMAVLTEDIHCILTFGVEKAKQFENKLCILLHSHRGLLLYNT